MEPRRRAIRDVIFLIKLHHQANFKVYCEQRAWNLTVLLLVEMMNLILTEGLREDALGKRSPSGSTPKKSRRQKQIERLIHWKAVAEAFLVELLAIQKAVGSINTRYFDDHQVLFEDANGTLDYAINTTEQLVGMFNDTCFEGRLTKLEIDVEKLRKLSDTNLARVMSRQRLA